MTWQNHPPQPPRPGQGPPNSSPQAPHGNGAPWPHHPGGPPNGPTAPGAPPPYPGPQGPRRSRLRAKVVIPVAAVLVLALALVAGYLFVLKEDPYTSDVPLAKNPDVQPLPFPDMAKLGADTSPSEQCATLDKLFAPRGYLHMQSGSDGRLGTVCQFNTPIADSVDDGSLRVQFDVALLRADDAKEWYHRLLDNLADKREGSKASQDNSASWDDFQEFPSGEEGYMVYHSLPDKSNNGTGYLDVSFRSGDDTYRVNLLGSVVHPGKKHFEALPKEAAVKETVAVVKLLTGQKAGASQITPPKMQTHPALSDLPTPQLPLTGPVRERCAPMVTAAAKLPVEPKENILTDGNEPSGPAGTHGCGFESASLPAKTDGARSFMDVVVRDLSQGSTKVRFQAQATEAYGRELMSTLEKQLPGAGTGQTGPVTLYELPIGDRGYAAYYQDGGATPQGHLAVGYVSGDVYVRITMHGQNRTYADNRFGDDSPRPAEELLGELATFLTALPN